MTAALLSVRDLSVRFVTRERTVRAVDGVSFSVNCIHRRLGWFVGHCILFGDNGIISDETHSWRMFLGSHAIC